MWPFSRRPQYSNNDKGPHWKRIERLEEQVARLEKAEAERQKMESQVKARDEAMVELSRKYSIDLPSQQESLRKRDRPSEFSDAGDMADVARPLKRSTRVISVSQVADIIKEAGHKGKAPSGIYSVRQLARVLVDREDFNKKKWVAIAHNVVEDQELPKSPEALVAAVLAACVE
eukprot:TRINITY_DN20735_c1_g1_i1.p1 TRINITY_DN20735_c1_g1~~TRINITY_DN20735_c1_g1_i1.p1  ORF type:complete len:174 (-),score=37.19 TRINITY_DN20735_c1_g1_i1:1396-1917(-)